MQTKASRSCFPFFGRPCLLLLKKPPVNGSSNWIGATSLGSLQVERLLLFWDVAGGEGAGVSGTVMKQLQLRTMSQLVLSLVDAF